jgi:hypothetical protein
MVSSLFEPEGPIFIIGFAGLAPPSRHACNDRRHFLQLRVIPQVPRRGQYFQIVQIPGSDGPYTTPSYLYSVSASNSFFFFPRGDLADRVNATQPPKVAIVKPANAAAGSQGSLNPANFSSPRTAGRGQGAIRRRGFWSRA